MTNSYRIYLERVKARLRNGGFILHKETIEPTKNKPRIRAGFKTKNGFTFLYVDGKLAGYRMPEYVYFKGKKIFT